MPTARLALALSLTPFIAAAARAADPRLDGYKTPPGWRVEVAATEPLVVNPVTMTWGPDARPYVIEWTPGAGPNDRVKVLTDSDGDGTFDRADMYIDHLDMPAGILFWDGWTYLTLGHDVVRWKDKDGDGNFETKQVVATGFGNDDSHHRVSGMTIGPDGWLYLTTGDSDAHAKGSDGSEATVLRSGGVFRCKPDGSKIEVVAFGMRNPWGNVCFDSNFNMFHTDNDNEGSEGFTGCRLLHVVEGGDYGWRLREGARCCMPDYDRATWDGGRPGRLGPITLTGRGAPAGLCCLNSAAFPPPLQNVLIYPDVFRKLVRGYKLKPAGATFAVEFEFELLSSDDPLFRPDDAEVGPDGALYILDWRTDSGGAGQHWGNGKTGRIYRMTWSGTDKEPARKTFPRDRLVGISREAPDRLVDDLESDDFGLRNAASLELLRRWRSENPGTGHLVEVEAMRRRWAGIETRLIQAIYPYHPGKDSLLPAARPHALAILLSLAEDGLPENSKYPVLFLQEVDRSLKTLSVSLVGRFIKGDEARVVFALFRASDGLGSGAVRAQAMALGHFDGVRRAKEGEPVSWRDLEKRYDDGTDKILLKKNINKQIIDKWKELFDTVVKDVTKDMMAQRLMELGRGNLEADPFLRDAVTRGLERLGPAGLEAVVKGIGSDDKKTAEAALFALQGWRSARDVDAILAAATGRKNIPEYARANLFRALREMRDAVPVGPIADWLRENEKHEAEPRAVAVKVLAAMGARASKEAGPIVPGLLKDESAEVRRAAIELAGSARSDEAEKGLVALVEDDRGPVAERRKGLEELRKYHDHELVPKLEQLFGSTRDPGLRGDLLRTLAPLDFAAASGRAKAALEDQDRGLRHEAIALLGQRPETALEVATLYNAGKVPREDLPRVIEAVRSHASPGLQAATQALLKGTLLAAPQGAEAERLREFVRRNGNPGRGKAIFLDPKRGNCAACHRLEGVGTALGPDLTRVWQTLSFEKRAESILDPSKEIKEGYRTFKVATTDGRVVTGLLVADKADGVTLKDSQGREATIPAAEVDQKGPDSTSLMPAGAAGNLSLNELADLLAFLGDREAQESLRVGR
jgi:putative membrane-bound dehydrogenase-like protein